MIDDVDVRLIALDDIGEKTTVVEDVFLELGGNGEQGLLVGELGFAL